MGKKRIISKDAAADGGTQSTAGRTYAEQWGTHRADQCSNRQRKSASGTAGGAEGNKYRVGTKK